MLYYTFSGTYAINAAHAQKTQEVDAKHLLKVWIISLEEAKETLKATSQGQVDTPSPKIAKNYGTNDRMLRYKHIKEYFFMGTLFATSRDGKLVRRTPSVSYL